MPSVDRRAREKAAVQEKILSAARDLFVREGYDAVSMRKIADAIEYTPPAIYTHFRDKASLMRELCRRDFGHLSQVLVKVGKIVDPVERIARLGRGYVRFAVEHPNQYRLMFMTPHPPEIEPDADDRAAMNDPERDGYAALRHAVRQAIEQGKLRSGHSDVELIAQVVWSCVHGVASLQITHAEDPCLSWRSLDARTRTVIDAVMLGLLAPAAAKEYRS